MKAFIHGNATGCSSNETDPSFKRLLSDGGFRVLFHAIRYSRD